MDEERVEAVEELADGRRLRGVVFIDRPQADWELHLVGQLGRMKLASGATPDDRSSIAEVGRAMAEWLSENGFRPSWADDPELISPPWERRSGAS